MAIVETQSPRLLIVDDEWTKRGLIEEVVWSLQKRNDFVLTAADVEEAYDLINRNPTLVAGCVDYSMPHGTGFDVAKHWRKVEVTERRVRAQIAIVTSHTDGKLDRIRGSAPASGVDAIIGFSFLNENRITDLETFLRAHLLPTLEAERASGEVQSA